mgnify:CR=1 FL=1
MGLLVGGIIPAVLLGLFGVLQKAANNAGIGTGSYLIFTGITVSLVGVAVYFLFPDKTISGKAALFTCAAALLWAVSMLLIQLALGHYSIEISRLVPLFNMNTLVAVVLGLVIFAEWNSLNLPTLLMGALCITIGGVLVASS